MWRQLSAAIVFGVSSVAVAQSGVQPEPAQPVLVGPSIEGRSENELTLVQWGYDGRLVRLETTPEKAAIELLTLEPAVRERVDQVLAERMAIFDQVVIESLDLVSRFQSARALKDSAAMRQILGEFMGRLTPLVRRGPAVLEIARQLPDDQARTFKDLVKSYQKAVLADERNLAQREHRKFHPIQATLKARGEELGQEIERSIGRSAAMADAGFEMLLQSLDLDPEVEAMVRNRTIEFVERTKLNASKEEQERFIMELFMQLDRASRVKAMSGLLKFQSRGLDYGYKDHTVKSKPASESDQPKP